VRRRAHGLLLALPAVIVAAQFAPLGADKPGEFGRFLLLPDVFLAIEAVVAAGTFFRPGRLRTAVIAAVLAATGVAGGVYLRGFVRDSRDTPLRLAEAERLRHYLRSGFTRMAVVAEPAPYGLPPVDLFRWQILKLPDGTDPSTAGGADVLVRAVDNPGRGVAARISWADKPFQVRVITGGPCCGSDVAPATQPSVTPTPPNSVP
jgi:hypothetical protein